MGGDPPSGKRAFNLPNDPCSPTALRLDGGRERGGGGGGSQATETPGITPPPPLDGKEGMGGGGPGGGMGEGEWGGVEFLPCFKTKTLRWRSRADSFRSDGDYILGCFKFTTNHPQRKGGGLRVIKTTGIATSNSPEEGVFQLKLT